MTDGLAAPDFGWMIDPMSSGEFIAEYWERRPLHIARPERRYYAPLLCAADFDRAIRFGRPKPPEIRLVKDQVEVLPADYIGADGQLVMNQVYKKFDEGYSVIINGLQVFWAPLADFANRVTIDLNHRVVPNAYYSPAGSTALKPHFDTHDVFVLQVEGAKTWHVYPPAFASPAIGAFQPVFARESLGKPMMSVSLTAGDMLYVPRGFIHEAETGTSSSLHITVGIYPTQWSDLFTQAVQGAAMREEALRKALPIGFLNDSAALPALREHFTDMARLLGEHIELDETLEQLRHRFIAEMPPAADGHFAQVDRLDDIDADSVLVRRVGTPCRLIDTGDAVRLQFPGNVIKGTPGYREAFDFIVSAEGAFTVEDLPDALSAEHKLKLACRLVRGGLLRVAAHG